MTRRMYICGITVVLFASPLPPRAQESRVCEISLQGTGFFSRGSSGNGTAYSAQQRPVGSLPPTVIICIAGSQAEIVYGYDRDTQKFAYTSSLGV